VTVAATADHLFTYNIATPQTINFHNLYCCNTNYTRNSLQITLILKLVCCDVKIGPAVHAHGNRLVLLLHNTGKTFRLAGFKTDLAQDDQTAKIAF